MKLFRTSSLYVVDGHLESPKPSNMSSKFFININYIIHTIFINCEENITQFYYKIENNKSIYMFHRILDT